VDKNGTRARTGRTMASLTFDMAGLLEL